MSVAVEISYGRKRALEIATTLALDPEMLLLDEPMAGMGHEDVERIAALIRRVSANRTILMVEHNLQVVADLSDTITVLTRGRVLAEGDYATVSDNPKSGRPISGSGMADGSTRARAPRRSPFPGLAGLVRRIAHPARRRFRRAAAARSSPCSGATARARRRR